MTAVLFLTHFPGGVKPGEEAQIIRQLLHSGVMELKNNPVAFVDPPAVDGVGLAKTARAAPLALSRNQAGEANQSQNRSAQVCISPLRSRDSRSARSG